MYCNLFHSCKTWASKWATYIRQTLQAAGVLYSDRELQFESLRCARGGFTWCSLSLARSMFFSHSYTNLGISFHVVRACRYHQPLNLTLPLDVRLRTWTIFQYRWEYPLEMSIRCFLLYTDDRKQSYYEKKLQLLTFQRVFTFGLWIPNTYE